MQEERREKAAFVLFPYSATPKQVEEYVKILRKERPDARIMLSVPRERKDLLNQALLKRCDFFACGEDGDHLITRAIPPLSDLVYRDTTIVYLVTSMLRYSAQNTLDFASKCEKTQSGILLLGEPPVMDPKSNSEIAEALKNPEILRNIMVDVFTSYIACQTNRMIYGEFMNLNAGIFAFRTRHASAGNTLREMLSKISYRDSNLLSLSIALSMGANVSVRAIPLDTINLDLFTGGLTRRILDLRFVLSRLIAQRKLEASPAKLMEDVFSSSRFKPIFQEKDREWFKTEVLDLGEHGQIKNTDMIKQNPMRNYPLPDLKRGK